LAAKLGAGAVTVNGNVTFSAAGRLNAASTLLIQGGTLTLSGNESVNSFQQTGGTVAGGFTINSATDSDLQSGTFSGNLGGSSGINKTGVGTTTITGTNSYTGATNVTSGTLVVNGNIASSSLTTVASGATIGGSGTVGVLTVSSGGFINPGNSPGILNTGNYTQVGTYTAEITGLTAGTEHDQINVTGTVDISGGSLTTLFTGSYSVNDLIFILLNDGADTITGTYNGLAQGATFSSGGYDWSISYTADSAGNSFLGGNDIALTIIPEPKTALLGCLGVLLILRRRR
jgi:autotransporter-associated beta strand protein